MFQAKLLTRARRAVREPLSAIASAARSLDDAERIAVAAVLASPVALLLDYRLDFELVRDTITYTPFLENAARPVVYEQLIGATQLVWSFAALAVAVSPRARRGFASATALCLFALLLLVVAATLVRTDADAFTFHALLSNLVPIWFIAVVVCNPAIRLGVIQALISVFSAAAGVAVLASMVKSVAVGTPLNRVDAYMFGPPTEVGPALAVLLVICLLAGWGGWKARALVALPLAIGVLVTETRGALVATVAGIAVAALFVPRWRALLVAGSAALVTAFLVLSDRPLTSLTDPSNALRRQTLEHHWLLFRQEPLLGYGLSSQSAYFFREAQNTLLGIANAAGIGAVALWLAAWFAPLARAFAKRAIGPVQAAGAGGLAAALVGWNTTGSEVLIYIPPTNLLPIAFATALTIASLERGRAVPAEPPEAPARRPRRARATAG